MEDEELDSDKVEYAQCDGCGIEDETVYNDGWGFNICGHGCNQYSVRGLSPSMFL